MSDGKLADTDIFSLQKVELKHGAVKTILAVKKVKNCIKLTH